MFELWDSRGPKSVSRSLHLVLNCPQLVQNGFSLCFHLVLNYFLLSLQLVSICSWTGTQVLLKGSPLGPKGLIFLSEMCPNPVLNWLFVFLFFCTDKCSKDSEIEHKLNSNPGPLKMRYNHWIFSGYKSFDDFKFLLHWARAPTRAHNKIPVPPNTIKHDHLLCT